MIVVENGAAYALTEQSWLAFLESRAAGATALAAGFGCEVGDVLCDVRDVLTQGHNDGPFADCDPFADLVVTEDGRAVALTPDQWLCYLSDSLRGAAEALSEYGSDLGEVAPAVDMLTGVCASILAAGIRAAQVATVAPLPSPAGVAEIAEAA